MGRVVDRDLLDAEVTALWCRDASLLVDAYENGVEPLQARHSDCLAVKWASHGEPGEARSARPASEEGSQ